MGQTDERWGEMRLPPIARTTSRRAFVQWFVLLLVYCAMSFFAQYQYGMFTFIWLHDFTYMSSIIAIVFMAMIGFEGVATYHLNNRPKYANSITIFGRSMAYIVTLFGLLGTAMGLMYQVGALAHLDVSNTQTVLEVIKTIAASLSTALLTTVCGILASIGITAMNSNVEYFLDNQEN